MAKNTMMRLCESCPSHFHSTSLVARLSRQNRYIYI